MEITDGVTYQQDLLTVGVYTEMTKLSNELKIQAFIHCGLCAEEFMINEHQGESPQSLKNYDVGWTKEGIQIWCVRHNVNIMHIDFEGHKHPANTTRKEPKK